MSRSSWLFVGMLGIFGCSQPDRLNRSEGPTLPDLLLVTLDTTRADAVGTEALKITPNLASLAARATVFTHAYTTAPTTLPAHASMLTGLYPAGHRLHENGRRLSTDVPMISEELQASGFICAAFVSGFPLSKSSGLNRGFHVYDDELPDQGGLERRAARTTDRALAWLHQAPPGPIFLWVHYFDPHDPYEPPEPFRSRFFEQPYFGEIAFVDDQLARLVEGFQERTRGRSFRALFVGDHGEGLGEHGERYHGYLLYQGTVRVPLILWDPKISPSVRSDPVSVRQVRDTFREAAGLAAPLSLTRPGSGGVPLVEAMEPFLQHRWQPQIAGIFLPQKLIHAGRLELYDLDRDPQETRDLLSEMQPNRHLAKAVRDYPLPQLTATPAPAWSQEELSRLQSLGYLAPSESQGRTVSASAPRAADQTHLFDLLDKITRALGQHNFAVARPLLERLVREDPGNLMGWVRLGVVRGQNGDGRGAVEAFQRARSLDSESVEVAQALGLEWLRQGEPARARIELDRVLARDPWRLPALLGCADALEQTGNLPGALACLDRAVTLTPESYALLLRRGLLRMNLGQTAGALTDLEAAKQLAPDRFDRHLELGVLLLATRRLEEARSALDYALSLVPFEPMALFKRAQLSVLLQEPDSARRIALALEHATPETRKLVESERLFQPFLRNDLRR